MAQLLSDEQILAQGASKKKLLSDQEILALPAPSFASGAIRSLAEGATFGQSQELFSGIDSLLGKGNYKDLLAEKEAQDNEISPWVRIPGQVAGAVASTLALAPLAMPLAARAGLTALPRAVQYGGLGALEGGLFGAGTAPSGEKIEGAAKGAAIGAPVGVAAPYVASGVARLASSVRGAASPEANVAADLGRAIRRNDDTPANMLQRFQSHQPDRAGVITLGDVGGENVRGLVERVAQTPGAGRNIVVPRLTARQHEQAHRIGEDLRNLTGTNQTALQATQSIMANRAAAARPLYQQAYQEGEAGLMSPNLERMMSSDAVVKAMREAVTKGRDRSVTEGFGSFNPRISVNENGVVRFVRGADNRTIYPDLRFWDYTKRALDDAAGTAARAGRNDEAGVIRDLARQMRTELDSLVPSYRAARDAWAGPSAYLDAVEQGRNIMARNVSAEEMNAAFAGLSQAEQEGFRVGAISSIVARMGNDAARLGDMTKYLRSPEMMAKIASIMPNPQAAQSWANRLQLETDASELTGRALGNSATARRLAERADAEGLVGDLVMDAITGTAGVGMLRRIITAGPRWLRDTLRARADRVLGNALTDPNITDAELNRLLAGAQRSNQPPGALPNAATAAGGVALTAH